MCKGSEIRIIRKLGEGSFSEVFLGKSTSTGEMFAIKRLKKRYHTFEEVQHLPEIYALQALQGHPNIIDLLNLSYDPNSGYVSMFFELMDCNVYELISEHKKPFDERSTLILIYQLLKAISFIHSKNMFHRDIKPENCMVVKNTMELKLCDFGSTRSVTNVQPYTEYVSTRWYRAPECILTSGSYGAKIDEWAVGCMLYEIMTTRPLFPGKNEIDQIGRIHNLIGTPSYELLETFKQNPNTQIQFSFPQRQHQDLRRILPNASKETVFLMENLLKYNPEDRISAQDALDLPIFDEIRYCEEEWQSNDRTLPFPLYYLQKTKNSIHRPIAQPHKKVKYSDDNSQDYKTKLEQQQKYFQEQYYKQQQKQQYYQSPGAIVTHHQFPISEQKQQPVAHGYYQTTKPKQPISYAAAPSAGQTLPILNKQNKDISLMESRLKAAQRIAEYKKKQLMFSKKPQPFHANPIQLSGPKIKGSYQHPRVELVQPRLPKIII